MDLENIHFIREIVIADKQGKKKPVIQISYARPSETHPKFQTVPDKYQSQMRTLYREMGGGRLDEWLVGLTIIIPNSRRS